MRSWSTPPFAWTRLAFISIPERWIRMEFSRALGLGAADRLLLFWADGGAWLLHALAQQAVHCVRQLGNLARSLLQDAIGFRDGQFQPKRFRISGKQNNRQLW